MPELCGFWDCEEKIQESHIMCYEHFIEYENGLIDECSGYGSLAKRDQQLIVKECGEDSNKLFLLMADLSKSQAETMLTSKLKASFGKMLLYSVSDSYTLIQEYANQFGIPEEYIDLLKL